MENSTERSSDQHNRTHHLFNITAGEHKYSVLHSTGDSFETEVLILIVPLLLHGHYPTAETHSLREPMR